MLANLNSFPRIPLGEGDLSTAGIIAAVGVAVTSLVGAIVGGLAGMRFHRRVDKAGLGNWGHARRALRPLGVNVGHQGRRSVIAES